ncbi:MAG: hypothetical protein HMLIMOIP_001990 [Candidatus Nitrosomirales archaeon]|jgi:hypothetical protein
MNGQQDHFIGTAAWWLGLAIAISMGSLFAIPYPFGLAAIALTFLIVGYMIPMRIIDSDTSKTCASSRYQETLLHQ